MRRLRVHVVYEHGPDLAPYGAAEVRLLRPLTHPTVKPWLELSFGRLYDGSPVDALIVDRLVSPRLGASELDGLIARARAAGAVLIHALDDDFLDLGLDRPHWADRGQARTLQRLLRAADGLLVTTQPLAGRLAGFSDTIVVLPNALDERLLASPSAAPRPDGAALALGYMGTFTHAEDLAMVLPALRAAEARQPGRFELQVVGVADPERAAALLDGLPWRWIEVPAEARAYPAFMRWFTGSLDWDLAIAPLADTPFTRCKSDLKHLDYAALGAAGIFSHVPAYAGTVRHAETGWLAPNQAGLWEAGLERLLDDAALRARLASGARAYLEAERTLARRGPDWVEAIHQLVERGRRGRAAGGSGAAAAEATASPEAAWRGGTALPAAHAQTPPIARPQLPALDRSSPPPRRLSVLYEYGQGQAFEPHASAHLRLIRPLTHPAAGDRLEPRFGPRFDDPGADLVILDRLWRPDVSQGQVERLLEAVRTAGARLVLALDDNLLDLRAERGDWPSEAHEAILRQLLIEADGLMVSSEPLAARLRLEAPRARMLRLPNALDERLLGRAGPPPMATPLGRRPLVIGYMGTATHDEDLALVLPALRAVCARHPGAVRIELIGVLRRRASLAALEGLPLVLRRPHPADAEYTRFMPWFTGSVGWDIAIAPLLDTPFRRCKSDVKFLDGCAVGAAMVCSDMPAYAGTVRHGETGWLAENRPEAWEEALERLIADAEQRTAIARAGRRYLMRERVLAHRAGDWSAALLGLLDG